MMSPKELAVLACCVIAGVLVIIAVCVPGAAERALFGAAVAVVALGLGIEAAA
jgi:hypothetical protein